MWLFCLCALDGFVRESIAPSFHSTRPHPDPRDTLEWSLRSQHRSPSRPHDDNPYQWESTRFLYIIWLADWTRLYAIREGLVTSLTSYRLDRDRTTGPA